MDSLSRRVADEGVLSSTYEDLSFGPRLAAVVSETGGSFLQQMEISLPQSGIYPDSRFTIRPRGSISSDVRGPALSPMLVESLSKLNRPYRSAD